MKYYAKLSSTLNEFYMYTAAYDSEDELLLNLDKQWIILKYGLRMNRDFITEATVESYRPEPQA